VICNPGAAFGGAGAVDEEDEDALMQRALEMSMMEMLTVTPAAGAAGASAGQESKAPEGEEDVSCVDVGADA
jgi:hypothetical protein